MRMLELCTNSLRFAMISFQKSAVTVTVYNDLIDLKPNSFLFMLLFL